MSKRPAMAKNDTSPSMTTTAPKPAANRAAMLSRRRGGRSVEKKGLSLDIACHLPLTERAVKERRARTRASDGGAGAGHVHGAGFVGRLARVGVEGGERQLVDFRPVHGDE